MTAYNSDRLTKLLDMLEQNPADSFLLYAIALEYAAAGRLKEAIDQLEQLLDAQPEYLATYCQLGKFLEQIAETERAALIYEKGLEVARAQGNHKTLAELQAALDLL